MQKRSVHIYKCLKMMALLLVVRSTLSKEHGSLDYQFITKKAICMKVLIFLKAGQNITRLCK